MDSSDNSQQLHILDKTLEMEDEDLFSENKFTVLSSISDDNNGDLRSSGESGWKTKTTKRKRGNNGSVDIDTFGNMGTDDKLKVLFEKISNVENCQKQISDMSTGLQNTTTRVCNLESRVQTNTDTLIKLTYKFLQLDTRNRNRNLIVYGLTDDEQNVYDQVSDFLYDYLDVDSNDVEIESATKFGQRRDHNYRPRRRATVVTFRYSDHVDLCLRKAYKLAGSAYAIDRDYPLEIQQARKRIWPEYKRLRHEHRSAVKMVFPAAIKIGQNTVRDEFPEWDRLINGRVVTDISQAQTNHISANVSMSAAQSESSTVYNFPKLNNMKTTQSTQTTRKPEVQTQTYGPSLSQPIPKPSVNSQSQNAMEDRTSTTQLPLSQPTSPCINARSQTSTEQQTINSQPTFIKPATQNPSLSSSQNNKQTSKSAVKTNPRARSRSTSRASRPRAKSQTPTTNRRQDLPASVQGRADDRSVGGATGSSERA